VEIGEGGVGVSETVLIYMEKVLEVMGVPVVFSSVQ